MQDYKPELKRLSVQSEMFIFLIKCLVTCIGCLTHSLIMRVHADSGREFVVTSFLIVLVFSYFLAHLGCTIVEVRGNCFERDYTLFNFYDGLIII